ncbi:fumarylacetoacetate hydrolase family protein [Sulfitobacter sp. M57]|nr:fumarylacetoacetate hydrolase family protein [Sulfitobacter sp. KE5]MDF3422542.1 fumarylacetoacetate hydrolase family protein [Sulfitobacter sp. KE43]MDF3433607.1 fumarylacetoacetate hydrolase family protein [Sulfitobacter sp. KE42]MDF3459247.1 fumarylacetoacetate hydrolase family protein [Sulfitobacter sp. S74]MDF3463146.1 fumarylacetoacetate hydrolase family protein [Sulfitobacter sp. Ks18]MDF3467046.1 fumarylacetoacetate hydrolase family protein [Sulfitobacter sp. M05]MDF3470941.1 fumar
MRMFVFAAPQQASLAVQGSTDRFPVRRIFCVGRNYEAHAREMGKDPTREAPFFFTKPADAALDTPCTIAYPKLTNDLHHEIELVIAIHKGGSDIAEADVMDHVWGAAVGLDMTRRDLQAEAKKMGRPWDWGKAFDRSAPIGPIKPIAQVPSVENGRIWLAVNGETRQDADIADLIWSVREHIAILSQAVDIAPGDIIMTGTPAGVGAVVPGDVITGGVDGIGELQVTIGERA